MKCFVDLEGTIPAQVGDRVACATCGEMILTQPNPDMRPIMVKEGWIDGDVRTQFLEGEIK